MALIFYQQPLAFLIVCVEKATVLLLFAWLSAAALHRLSAAVRHHIWAVATLASLALPLLVLSLPAWHSAALDSAAAFLASPHASSTSTPPLVPPPVAVNAAVSSPLAGHWSFVALLLWACGFSVIANRLLAGLLRLVSLCSRAKPLFDDSWLSAVLRHSNSLKIRRPVLLLECHNSLAMPLTCGIFRPVIVLPAGADQWPADRRDIVLSHELAHIARHDWLLQICAELARAIYWFQPLQWLAAARLRRPAPRSRKDIRKLRSRMVNHARHCAPFQPRKEICGYAESVRQSS